MLAGTGHAAAWREGTNGKVGHVRQEDVDLDNLGNA